MFYVGNILCQFYSLRKFIYLSLYHNQIRVMHISLQKLHANLMAYRRIWQHVKSKFSKALCTSYILLHYTSFVEMKSAMNLDCFRMRVQIWWGSKKYIISSLNNIFWFNQDGYFELQSYESSTLKMSWFLDQILYYPSTYRLHSLAIRRAQMKT